jgi:acyl-CoA thioester hydrolase
VSTPDGSRAPHWQPLRFRDLDAFGHVYHAEYLTLLDEARTRWLGDVVGVEDPGSYVLARVEIDYLSSLTLEDQAVRVEFAVLRVGTTSLTLAETMHARDGRVVARGRAVAVLRDRATGGSRRLSEGERASAEAERASAEAERASAEAGQAAAEAERG